MFVAVKALSKTDATGTVSAVISALETDCECSDWQSKLVAAAVSIGVCSSYFSVLLCT